MKSIIGKFRSSIVLIFTFETVYFGSPENMVNQQKLIRLGENLAKTLIIYEYNR